MHEFVSLLETCDLLAEGQAIMKHGMQLKEATDALRQFGKQQAIRREAARAVWKVLQSDAQVVELCKRHQMVLQHAFQLGCNDRPPEGVYDKRSGAVISVVGVRMDAAQFVQHAFGSGKGTALLGPPVVVHVPTPCVLHRGEITKEAGRPV